MAKQGSRILTRRHFSLLLKTIALASCLLVFEPSVAGAMCQATRFQRFSPRPAAHTFNATAIVSTNDAWAVGLVSSEDMSASATLAEHWNGTQWSPVLTPSPGLGPRSSDSLNGVAAVASDDVWAVGQSYSYSATLIEHWDGSSWSVVPSPSIGTTSYLTSVTATSSTNVWAAGVYSDSSGKHALVEMWNGSVWSIVPDPDPVTLTSISATSSTDVWATGNDIEHWDGRKWSVVSSLPALSVSAVTPNNVWVVDGEQVSHWNGKGWTPVTTIYRASLRAIAAAPRYVWVVGQLNGQLFTARYDGLVWTQPQVPPVGVNPTFEAIATFGSSALAVGGVYANQFGGLKAVWNGSMWAIAKEPRVDSESNEFTAAWSNGPADIWTVNRAWPVWTSRTTFVHWDGTNWSKMPIPSKMIDVYDIGGISASDGWAVGDGFTGCGGEAMAAHWNGTAWVRLDTPVCASYYSDLDSVSVTGSGDMWAGGVDVEPGCMLCGPYGFGIILHRSNKAWKQYDFDVTDYYSDAPITSVRALSDSDVWAIGPHNFKHGVSDDYIYHFDGASWSTDDFQPPEHYGFLTALGVASKNDIWAVGGQSHSDHGAIDALIVHYDGVSWKAVKHGPAPGGALTSIVAISSNDVWAAGGSYLAHWNGTMWSFFPTRPGFSLNRVQSIPGSTSAFGMGYEASPYLNSLSLADLLHC